MSWIKTIGFEEAAGKLKRIYNRVKGPDNNIDNVLKIHSLRPHTLNGHMVLYKSVLHHSGNSFPKWYLELLGTYVSSINKCQYCLVHHAEGLRKNLPSDMDYDIVINAVLQGRFHTVLTEKMDAGCAYAYQLTVDTKNISEFTIEHLRNTGFDDGEILEVNQVVSYFNYVNRVVLGLGVNTDGDIIGLSPGDSDDEENWAHT